MMTMLNASKFDDDLDSSKKLNSFMDRYFYRQYARRSNWIDHFRRNNDIKSDYTGTDVICHLSNGGTLLLDEKATLDYKDHNCPLPTFAFELGAIIKGAYVEGWLTNPHKMTDEYVLIWPQRRANDEGDKFFELAEVMFINRKQLLNLLNEGYGLNESCLRNEAIRVVKQGIHAEYKKINEKRYERAIDGGRIKLVHSLQKSETPLNIVIKKELLINVAPEVIWVRRGYSLRRIPSKKYFSPDSWDKVYNFFIR